MFTKHLQGLDLYEIIAALQSVGVEGADMCVRPGYPVHPGNAAQALPEAARRFRAAGLSIPVVTAPTDLIDPSVAYAERLYAACAEAGVSHLKPGYWHWTPGENYGQRVEQCRAHLQGFQELSAQYGVQTVVHTHSGRTMGLNASAVMDLVQGFDPRYVGVYADPGHLSIVGEPIDMALAIVRDYLSVLSFKDLKRQRVVQDGQVRWNTRVVPLGEGYGDWPTLLRTLRALPYDGPVSFHSEYSGQPPETVIDQARIDVRFINRLLQEIED
jgi:sugar phosphate isomerase/epimerase